MVSFVILTVSDETLQDDGALFCWASNLLYDIQWCPAEHSERLPGIVLSLTCGNDMTEFIGLQYILNAHISMQHSMLANIKCSL